MQYEILRGALSLTKKYWVEEDKIIVWTSLIYQYILF